MTVNVTQRYSTNPRSIPGMDTNQLRENYLVPDLFAPDQINAVYTHEDRVVLVGLEPVKDSLTLTGFAEIRSESFFEHREAGIVNVGGAGSVEIAGKKYDMVHGACLYIGKDSSDPVFSSNSASEPALFYVFSAPAHKAYPTTLVEPGGGNVRELGDPVTSNRRTLNQYIHNDGVQSCQVVMGVTTLHEGSMWNTMPAHTHERRTECYLYFDVPEYARVLHILGRPQETRHMVVANDEAIISPSWSVHCGVGTALSLIHI